MDRGTPRNASAAPNGIYIKGMSLSLSGQNLADYERIDMDRGYLGDSPYFGTLSGKLIIGLPSSARLSGRTLSIAGSFGGFVPTAKYFEDTIEQNETRAMEATKQKVIDRINELASALPPILQDKLPLDLVNNMTVEQMERLINRLSGLSAQYPLNRTSATSLQRSKGAKALASSPRNTTRASVLEELRNRCPVNWEDILKMAFPGPTEYITVPAYQLPSHVVDVMATFKTTIVSNPVEVEVGVGAGVLSVTPHGQSIVDAELADINHQLSLLNLALTPEVRRERTFSCDLKGTFSLRKQLGPVTLRGGAVSRFPVHGIGIKSLSAYVRTEIEPLRNRLLRPIIGGQASSTHYDVPRVLEGLPGIPRSGQGTSGQVFLGVRLGDTGFGAQVFRAFNQGNRGDDVWGLSFRWDY